MRSKRSRHGNPQPQTKRRKQAIKKARLSLERLEDRLALATMVSLDGNGNLMIADAIGGTINNNLTIKSDTTNAQFVITDTNAISTNIATASGGGTTTLFVPMSSVTGSAIFVNTMSGDDFLTVDFSAGNFSKTVSYDGGLNNAGVGDELRLQGGSTFANVTHTHVNASSGSVSVTGNGLISYAGLEPITDNLSATDRVFTFTGGSESILLDDVLGSPAMVVDSTLGEFVIFMPPTNSLTIDAGTGNDSIQVAGYDNTFAAALILNGGTGDDTFNIRPVNSVFNGSLIVHGGANHDTVNFFNDMTFAANRILEVNLEDDPTPVGVDRIFVGSNANYVLSGTGTATLKASAGISLATGSSIVTADGALILEGNGPGTGDASFMGVTVDGATVQSTGSGAVQVLGRGGVGTANNFGVLVMANGTSPGIIQSGSGSLQVTGTGGLNATGLHVGVYITGNGTRVGSTGGNVQVTGEGGAGNSSANNGVNVEAGAQISAGGAGTVSVQGTGGTGGGPNVGVRVTAGGMITSTSGNVQVAGVGRASVFTNGNNHGVNVSNGGQISAGGAGTVTVHGTAGTAGGISNHGVLVTGSSARITSNGGAIQVTGTQGAAGPSTPSFGINVTFNGGIGYPGNAILELISDSINFDGSAVVAAGTSTVTLRQRTNGTTINLGAADSAGVLGLTDLELDRVTAGTINIGDLNSGTMTLSVLVSRGPTTNLNLTTGGDITFLSGFLLDVLTGSLTLSAPNGSITTPPGTSVTAPDLRAPTTSVDGVVAPGGGSAGDFAVVTNLVFTSTDRYRAQLDGVGQATQYDVITVSSGTATLGGATLEVLPNFAPSGGQPFTIVNTTGGVSGTFRDTNGNTLNEGDTFTAGGVQFRISYAGGSDGKDVVLTTGPSIFISDATVVETNVGTTTITFDVTLSAPGNQTIAVSYVTANGTATTTDNDYVAKGGTVGFAPGDTSEQVTITVNGDVKFEPNETFAVNLFNPVGAAIGDSQGVGTIVNDDVQPTVSVTGPPLVPEAFPGMVMRADFTVTLSNPSQETVTVTYATGGGTASGATDYASTSGTLTFTPGQTSQTLSVDVFGDTTYEPNETFNFNLNSATNATISSPGSVTATIVDDDPVPSITVGSFSGLERDPGSATPFTFQVSLSNPSYQTITVSYTTADGTALAGSDYTTTSGLVTFAPGETFKDILVPVSPDRNYEPDETFSVVLSSPTNAGLGSPHAGTGTIRNDDAQPTVTLSLAGSPLAENGGAATVTAMLSAASSQSVTVDLGFTGTATHPTDYSRLGTSIVIPAGSLTGSATLTSVDDPTDEDHETVIVDVISVTNGSEAGTQQVTAIITDDDAPPSLSISDVTVAEGDNGSVAATFTVSLSQASGQTVTVSAATADNSAVATSDYTAVATLVNFAPGQTTAQIQVAILGDVFNESDESFFVNLTAAVNATLADGQAVGTIVADDFIPVAAAGPDQTAFKGDLLSFDGGASSDLDGDPLTYSWNFGDGSGPAAGQLVTHAYANDGTYNVTLTVSDGHGGSSSDTLFVTVRVPPPTASLSGPNNGVRGQARAFAISVAGEPAVETTIAWGDGTTHPILTGPQSINLSHVYAATGTYTVTLTARNPDGATTVRSHNLTIMIAEMQGTTFAVGGTTANDSIAVEPTNTAGTSLRAIVNGATFGPFTSGSLVVFGQAGADSIVLRSITSGTSRNKTTSYVGVPATLFGDAGADIIDAGGSGVGNVLSGGDDDDQLSGGNARDLFFGGLGADILRGRNGDDLLVGNPTLFDNDLAALNALRAEWTRTDLGYAARIDHLLGRTTGGNNGSYKFDRTTVLAETFIDQLYGEGNQDWFLVLESETGSDSIKDRKKNETITRL